MNYWVHRFGHGKRSPEFNDALDLPAMCHLLEGRNCLTVGWHSFSDRTGNGYNPDIVNAVGRGDSDQVKQLMLAQGIDLPWAQSLIRFTKMQIGDIVVVLPNKEYVPYFFVVEIKSTAKSILNSSPAMTTPFNIGGVDYRFSPMKGWTRTPQSTVFDVGFFHEVELLKVRLPRDLIGDIFNHVRSTNSPVNDVSRQQVIDSLIP